MVQDIRESLMVSNLNELSHLRRDPKSVFDTAPKTTHDVVRSGQSEPPTPPKIKSLKGFEQ